MQAYIQAWDDYQNFKSEKNRRIAVLEQRAGKEYRLYKDFEKRTREAFNRKDVARGDKNNRIAERHHEKTYAIYAEIRELKQQIKQKRREFDEIFSSREAKEDFEKTRSSYLEAKEKLYESRDEFRALKADRDALARLIAMHELFERAIDYVWGGADDSSDKLVIHRYYGGENKPDGKGHGHQVIEDGEITYDRPPVSPSLDEENKEFTE